MPATRTSVEKLYRTGEVTQNNRAAEKKKAIADVDSHLLRPRSMCFHISCIVFSNRKILPVNGWTKHSLFCPTIDGSDGHCFSIGEHDTGFSREKDGSV